ncbi:sulfotransferase, partial [Pseudodesulfovibrio sp.]|uniref:sulfotransferase family protein n=1 Tax=Pseudodesulfovibrio sp. TaxID=2035812 RepID=UPI0026139564
ASLEDLAIGDGILQSLRRCGLPDLHPFPKGLSASGEVRALYAHLTSVEKRLLASYDKGEDIDFREQSIYRYVFRSSHELLLRQIRFVQEMKLQLLRRPEIQVKFPDFTVIGTPRAASTWSKKTMANAENVIFSANEPRPFSRAFINDAGGYLKRLEFGANEFLNAPDYDSLDIATVIQGEKDPDYLGLPDKQVEFIKMLMPDMKVVLLVRDPIDACWSNIQFELSRKGLNIGSLTEEDSFIRTKVMKMAERYDFWGYADGIRNWERHFGAIHYIFFEDIAEKPEQCARDLLGFLGSPEGSFAEETPFHEKINEKKVNVELPDFLLAKLRDRFIREYENWETLFGRKPKYQFTR